MPQTRDAKGRWMQSVVASDTLTGDKVVNRQKEDLGTIEHLMIDVKKGRLAYAVLSFGGFLGMGDKLFAIPWGALAVDTSEEQFILDIDRKVLEGAPGFDKAHWPNMADRAWGEELCTYYGLSFGGFLGMGDKLFAIPWGALAVDTSEEQFILDIDRKVLEGAPGFEHLSIDIKD